MSHRRRHQIRTELILILLLMLRLGLQGACFALEFIDLQPTTPTITDDPPKSITIQQCPFQIIIPLPTNK